MHQPAYLAIMVMPNHYHLALRVGDAIFCENFLVASTLSEEICDAVLQFCQKNNCELSNLTAIYTMTGPSAFTALRIGYNFAQGLAFGLNIPLYGMNHPQAYALKYQAEFHDMVVICDLRLAKGLAIRYKDGKKLGDYYLITKEDAIFENMVGHFTANPINDIGFLLSDENLAFFIENPSLDYGLAPSTTPPPPISNSQIS